MSSQFRLFAIVSFLLGISVLLTVCAHAEAKKIPPPSAPRTQAEFDAGFRKFQYNTIVGGYKEYGIHNAEWDDAAIRFLQKFVESQYSDGQNDEQNALMAEGLRLTRIGCNDPMVLSCAGIICRTSYPREALDMLERSLEGFENSRYPKSRVRLILPYVYTLRTIRGLSKYKDKEHYEQETLRLTAESLKDGSYKPGEQRYFLAEIVLPGNYIFQDNDGNITSNLWSKLYPLIKDDRRVDPYLMNYIAAHYYLYPYGWKPGKPQYTADDLKEFRRESHENQRTGRNFLISAYKLHPEFPEAPALMIDVVKSTLRTGTCVDDPRVWFERARKAQFDYIPAYWLYTSLLTPSWGYSYDDALKLGVECVKSGRFDTVIPLRLVDILNKITENACYYGDKELGMSYWRRPEAIKYLDIMCDGCAKASFNGRTPAYWKSKKAAYAYWCGRYSDVRKMIEGLGSNIDHSVFQDTCHASYTVVWQDACLLGSPFGREVSKARGLYGEGKHEEALQVYKQISRQPNMDSTVRGMINECIRQIESENAFSQGEWCPFMPSTDLVGWTEYKGKWAVDADGTLRVAKLDFYKQAGILRYTPLGKRMEIKGKFGFRTKPGNAGIILNCPDPKIGIWAETYAAVIFSAFRNSVFIGRQGMSDTITVASNLEYSDTNTFLIQWWDDKVAVYLNGKLVKKDISVPSWDKKDNKFTGLCAEWSSDAWFKDVEIRQLKEKPE